MKEFHEAVHADEIYQVRHESVVCCWLRHWLYSPVWRSRIWVRTHCGNESCSTFFFGKNRHFFFHNFFSLVALMRTLIQDNTCACATARTNRVGLPDGMKRHRELERGQHHVLKKITYWPLCGMKRDFSLISTNTPHGVSSVQWWDNRVRARVEVPCPIVVKLYNDCMGGVDMAYQMGRHYSAVKTL